MVVTVKPYEQMSLPALLGELGRWNASIERHVWGALRAQAERWRDECAAEIARRERVAA